MVLELDWENGVGSWCSRVLFMVFISAFGPVTLDGAIRDLVRTASTVYAC